MTGSKRTLIKNGTVVTAADTFGADVWIEGDKIVALTHASLRDQSPKADLEVDATGIYVMPGGIDAHTHMDMPFGGTTSSDDFETGTRAAAYGGTPCIVDFAIPTKGRASAACSARASAARSSACTPKMASRSTSSRNRPLRMATRRRATTRS